jgi:hypothetical protein
LEIDAFCRRLVDLGCRGSAPAPSGVDGKSRLVGDAVPQGAQAVDLNLDRIARLQP